MESSIAELIYYITNFRGISIARSFQWDSDGACSRVLLFGYLAVSNRLITFRISKHDSDGLLKISCSLCNESRIVLLTNKGIYIISVPYKR